jgi:hypothetical protein
VTYSPSKKSIIHLNSAKENAVAQNIQETTGQTVIIWIIEEFSNCKIICHNNSKFDVVISGYVCGIITWSVRNWTV